MMDGLDAIYDEAFFREWGRRSPVFVESARTVAAAVYEALRPRRMADVGCGCGVYADWFREKGVEVVAIDGVEPPAEDSFGLPIVRRDLTEPFDNEWGDLDLVLCLEVAEHIPEELSEPFLANLARLTGPSSTLALSAAPPHQGGHHHVNERPKRYWVRRLAEHGLHYDRRRTGRLLEACKAAGPRYGWMYQQISLYDRRPEPLPPERRPFGA